MNKVYPGPVGPGSRVPIIKVTHTLLSELCGIWGPLRFSLYLLKVVELL